MKFRPGVSKVASGASAASAFPYFMSFVRVIYHFVFISIINVDVDTGGGFTSKMARYGLSSGDIGFRDFIFIPARRQIAFLWSSSPPLATHQNFPFGKTMR
jgi:hypothetical protein